MVPTGEMKSSEQFVFNQNSRFDFSELDCVRNGCVLEVKLPEKRKKKLFLKFFLCLGMSSIINEKTLLLYSTVSEVW